MLCSNCSTNEATFHYKYIKNGASGQIHLCHKCATELGYIKEATEAFNPVGFLGELFSMPHFSSIPKEELICPSCHTSFDDIRRTGFVGCDKCYDAFSKPIEAILSKIQPSTAHKGKLSGVEGKKIERDNALKDLKEKLQRAILDENYEEAAVIRDRIKSFESEEGRNNG